MGRLITRRKPFRPKRLHEQLAEAFPASGPEDIAAMVTVLSIFRDSKMEVNSGGVTVIVENGRVVGVGVSAQT